MYDLWSQDIFSKGELSPFMYSRATVNEYGNGLKTAQNVLTYPTGAAGKRFGTLYQATLSALITASNQIFFQTFQYLNICTFQLVFYPLNIDVYIEGVFLLNITTLLDAISVFNLNYTTLGNAFRIAGQGTKPFDLVPGNGTPIAIVAILNNAFTFVGPFIPGALIPVSFTTTLTLPVTTPQIKLGLTYFGIINTATSMIIYSNATDAKFGLNPIILSTIGTGVNDIVPLNNWTFTASKFKNLPYYDFNGIVTSYDALTFTPSATMGTAVTITVSSAYAPLTAAYIGGAFFGAGGSSRITAVASTTSFTVSVQRPFDSTDPIQGSLALLAEPAWSDIRGWPEVCSSYQNRSLFANTNSLPNGFWASAINDYSDYGDLTNDDDDAISWFPTSNDINFIRFIVPYRSITVHTNSGIYSSPLSDVVAITPTNFTLQLQDSTPADVLQPTAIDNQILVLSGNDAHQMLWDGINNAYTSDIVSVINEQTIRDPVDETAFADLRRAGSRFVFITNANGSLAIFQTLLSQNVSGFTPHIMEQSYGDAFFRQTASNSDGRCWFVNERQIADAKTPLSIVGFTSSTLKAFTINVSTTVPEAITFTTTGTLPASTPPLSVGVYYWAIGTSSDDFKVYLTQEDALADDNEFVFTSSGTSDHVVPWPLKTIFTLEELTQKTFLDCAIYYNSTPTSTVSDPGLFNAQNVKMVGDGFGFEAIGVNNQVTFTAHGSTVNVSEAYIGFPIHTIIEPMPLSIAMGNSAKTTTLTKPKHIRTVRFMFNNTIGGTINGVPIALNSFNQANIGEPPFPARGFMELGIFKAWDDFNNPSYTIEHSDPFNIQLLGVFYSVEL